MQRYYAEADFSTEKRGGQAHISDADQRIHADRAYGDRCCLGNSGSGSNTGFW